MMQVCSLSSPPATPTCLTTVRSTSRGEHRELAEDLSFLTPAGYVQLEDPWKVTLLLLERADAECSRGLTVSNETLIGVKFAEVS